MAHHKLRRLRVYGGFLDKLDVRFSDGLNCLIGGRGSGKTTVLEFIRHALDRAPRSGTAAARLADDRLKSLLQANLGATGYVELEFESQEGLVYQIRRGAHDGPQVTDPHGKPMRPEVLGSSVRLDVSFVPEIPPTSSGKHRYVTSKVPPPAGIAGGKEASLA